MVQNKQVIYAKKRVRRLGRFLFALYVAALIYFLFFADWFAHHPGRYWEYTCNFMPLREIRRFAGVWQREPSPGAFLNLFGNVIGFIPFGFFLPVMSRKFRKASCAAAFGFLFSAAVECIQLVTRAGCCDVDDVILNTAGALLGYGLFLICDRLRIKVHGEVYG